MPLCGANDGIAELGLGGIVTLGKTDAVRMAREVLEVSPKRIRVDYVFERVGGLPVGPLPVMFPLPLYQAELPSSTWYGAPMGFSVHADGELVEFQTQVRGRYLDWASPCRRQTNQRSCAKDVTGVLKEAGLTDTQIALYPVASPFIDSHGKRPKVKPLTSDQVNALKKAMLLEEEGPSDERPYPTWLADVTYTWTMDFGARQRLEVAHAYVPFTNGGASARYLSERELRQDYCADEGTLRALRKLSAASDQAQNLAEDTLFVGSGKVEYILTTANSWAGPIGDFTLRLKKSHPAELIALCFPGAVRRVDPLTLEIHLKNFTPSKELRVIFMNLNDEELPGFVGTGEPPANLRKD